uniref:Major facilitator superfamily (MFS) profile domain-containing protein n=1 Tax=Glossina austeni TaxID=7395 RepID=A0A1A9UJJ4_GLOAU
MIDNELNEESEVRAKEIANESTLDAILVRIGEFGRFQLFNYVLLCLPMIFNAFQSISYVFTASSVVYRCNVTLCDSARSEYWEPWLNFTIPSTNSNFDQCHHYAIIHSSDVQLKCSAENFNSSQLENCNDYKFRDHEYTIANEFNFFCSNEWKLTMAGTFNNIGQFIGIPLGGLLADKFGRRTMLAIGGFLSSIMGLIKSFATNYSMFLTFETFDMIVGSTLYPTAFLLAIELVGPKRRVAAATIITMFYPLGEALLGVFAKQFQNWRILLRVLYAPAILHIFLLTLLPESIRWLLSQGKEGKAVAVLTEAAHVNGKFVPELNFINLMESNKQKLEDNAEEIYPIKDAIKVFFWRIANCSLCWFTHTLIALGLSLTSVNLGGNKYNNFIWNGLIQIPGLLLPLFVMDSLGRRISLFASMLTCALCMAATIFFAKYGEGVELALFLIGKFAITCSFQILYFFTSEIFPTKVRNSLLSLCSMVGRFGSMLAPQTPLLVNYYEFSPQILFASFALVSGCLTLLFPETANKTLPTTMAEASQLSKNVNHRKCNDN